jgi:deoxyribonuclease-4
MWQSKDLVDTDVDLFKTNLKKSGIAKDAVVVHMPYIGNLSCPAGEIYEKSINSFTSELIRCSQLGVHYLVINLGSGKEDGVGQLVRNCERAIDNFKTVYGKKLKVSVLLQNSGGLAAVQYNSIGSKLEELREILDRLPSKGFGICLDTCHAFVSGYDLKTHDACVSFIEKFDKIVNLSKLEFIHLNDSKAEIGSGLDNHEYVGLGKIGLEGFKTIINHKSLRNLPMIMEPCFVSIEDYSKKLREMLDLRD